MAAKKWSSLEKTSLLLLSFGEEVAAEVFKYLSSAEIRKIAGTMARIKQVDQGVINAIMEEFHSLLLETSTMVSGGPATTQQLLAKALGRERARDFADITVGQESLTALALLAAPQLADILRAEQPQTIATVLAYAEPAMAAETLQALPEALRAEVIIRIAHLGPVAPESLADLDDYLRAAGEKMGAWQQGQRGGREFVAALLGSMSQNAGNQVLEDLDGRDPELTAAIRSLMFTFQDLLKISQRDMADLLQAIDQKQLLLALKSASPAVREHILASMSQRAGARLLDDLAAVGPARVADVEAAQAAILVVARELAAAGKIRIQNSDDTYV